MKDGIPRNTAVMPSGAEEERKEEKILVSSSKSLTRLSSLYAFYCRI